MKARILHCVLPLAALAGAPLLGCGSSEPSTPTTTGSGASSGSSASSGAGGDATGGGGMSGSATSGSATGGGGTGAVGAGGSGGDEEEKPDYARAFPQDRVPRIDITISPENWQAMLDDMKELTGAEFGKGGGLFEPPPEWVEACDGLVAGDPCMISLFGAETEGTCAELPGGLTCQPPPPPDPEDFEPPPDWIAACDGLAVDDECTISIFGTDTAGTCTDFEGVLACVPATTGPGDPGLVSSVELLPRSPVYVECDVATEDRTWRHVGIRFKGNSSLLLPWGAGVWKLPLRFNFDRFEDTYPEVKNQRFYGFDALSFASNYLDPSFLRQKVAPEIFARAGIPVSATAFYRVFVDHGQGPVYFGLYTATEIPSDDSFLDTHFGGHEGNLYKPDGTGARWETWDPDTLVKQNHEEEADFSDARALFDALHADRGDAAAWRAGLEATLDVDGFLHWLALNAVMEDWDVYGRLPHNYYLYSDPNEGGRFTWIPWDHTFAFTAPDGPAGIGLDALSLSMSEVTEQWPLIRYLLDDPVYLETYRGYVTQAVEEEYETEALVARFQAAHDLIAPYVVGPDGEKEGYTHLTSPEEFEDALATLIAHVTERPADVAAYLAE